MKAPSPGEAAVRKTADAQANGSHLVRGAPDFGSTAVPGVSASEPAGSRLRTGAGLNLQRWGVLYGLVICIVLFGVLRPSTFPTALNFRTLLISEAVLAIISVGLMIPAAGGHYDLSIGYNVGFTGMVVAWLSVNGHQSPYVALVVGVLTGTVIGAVNGFVVVKLKMSSFIATLGSGIILSGLTLGISGGSVVFNVPHTITVLGQGFALGVEWPVFFALAVVLVVMFVMRFQRFGRYVYATGGNEEASRLAGIRTDRIVIGSMVLCGFFGGIAGILFMANAGSADPASGPDLLLPAFAAVFLGSTTIEPGRYNVIGTVLSLFFLAVLVNGLEQLGAPTWVAPVFDGVALIVAVAASIRERRRA